VLLVGCTLLVPLGLTDVVTYALSVAAIVITGVVLIGFRDIEAIHAKPDEIIVTLGENPNDVVGLEHEDPKLIEEAVQKLEREAIAGPQSSSGYYRIIRSSRSSRRPPLFGSAVRSLCGSPLNSRLLSAGFRR